MSNWKNIAVSAGIGGVIIGGLFFIPKLVRLKNAAPELDVVPSIQLHKIDGKGITVRMDVNLKNPTPADFKMKYPYIRLSYKDNIIGTSQSVNKDIGMPAFGEANIQQIMMTIPLLSLLSMGGGLLEAIQNNSGVKMNVTIITHIDPLWKYDTTTNEWKQLINLGKKALINYSQTKTLTLKK